MSRVEGKMSRVEGKCRGFKNVGIFLNFNKKKTNKQNKTKNTERKKIKLKKELRRTRDSNLHLSD